MQRLILVDGRGEGRGYAEPVMNRIKEIREAAGLTQPELAEKVGTTTNHIWRLESGKTKLTVEWMTRLAEALACHPADLIANVVLAEIVGEVEEIEPSLTEALIARHRGLHTYKVLARSVINAGINPGDNVVVDESDNITPKALDIVLVEIGRERTKVLRQFIPPSMLVTNRGGANLAITLDDPSVEPAIIGVVLRD